MENLSSLVSYYWNESGLLQQIVFVFWSIAVVCFYATLIYGLSIALFDYFKIKLYGKAN